MLLCSAAAILRNCYSSLIICLLVLCFILVPFLSSPFLIILAKICFHVEILSYIPLCDCYLLFMNTANMLPVFSDLL